MFRRSMIKGLGRPARAFSTATLLMNSKVRAGVLLQRDPIVLQQAGGFEATCDKYFEWLEYISAEKFPRDFFFKRGSSAESKWMELENERASQWYFDPANKPAFKPIKKAIFGEDTGVDEDSGMDVSRLIEVQPRETDADKSGDVKSLERKLDRTLYLLVKDSKGEWGLPAGDVTGEEVLSEAARRNLKEICGSKMNVWMVGNGPVGHRKTADHTAFYIKGHILAGQAKTNDKHAADFKWATREEVEGTVSAEYWQSVKDMLSTV
ncbi:hypothetical protein GGF39_003759 [Coemansia sp. RSA 1721]|nr:hypothetical protein GGF39_003759 [Coemansia sp. RSA 1721]